MILPVPVMLCSTLKIERWFYVFLLIHLTVWTLAPALIRLNLPMDALEGTTWGHQLALGYDKNPFLNAWLTRLAVFLSPHSGWATYLFSQLSVVLCFWAVFQLAKKMLPPVYAFISVLLLEGMQYYNFHAIDFNDNTLELGLWALLILFFYQSLSQKKLSDWMLTGLFAALSVMAKYYSGLLLLSMLAFLIFNPEARTAFRSRSLWIALGIFFIVITPHIIWLFSHDFVTVSYALNRVSSVPALSNHFFYPLQFSFQQFEAFLPVLIIFFILFIGKKSTAFILPHFDKTFLYYVGIGPLLLTVLLSAVTGIKLRAGWGQPLFSLWGILLIIWLMPDLSRQKLYRFVAVTYGVLVIMVTGYCIALMRADQPSSANFPGKMIAETLTQQWENQYHTKLTYVAGPRWLAGNIAFYSKDHPAVYIDWNKTVSPWINEKKLLQQGAIFVWDPTEWDHPTEADIRKRFAALGATHVMHFAWLRKNKHGKPVEINAAFLQPDPLDSNAS